MSDSSNRTGNTQRFGVPAPTAAPLPVATGSDPAPMRGPSELEVARGPRTSTARLRLIEAASGKTKGARAETVRWGTPGAPQLRQGELEVPLEWFQIELKSRAEAESEPAGVAAPAGGNEEARATGDDSNGEPAARADTERGARSTIGRRWLLMAMATLAVGAVAVAVEVGAAGVPTRNATAGGEPSAVRLPRDEQRQLPPAPEVVPLEQPALEPVMASAASRPRPPARGTSPAAVHAAASGSVVAPAAEHPPGPATPTPTTRAPAVPPVPIIRPKGARRSTNEP